MINDSADFWTSNTSVLFTSLWGWSPETWGTIGWTGDRGHTRRANLLKTLSDPFITACYVTSNKSYADPELKGKLAGFYLVSHELGDRDEFSHPVHHKRNPDKWRHSLRAIRAFSYLPEYRLPVGEFDPTISDRARSVASMCEEIKSDKKIALLREIPWVEVDVYEPSSEAVKSESPQQHSGMVNPGPASKDGYIVSSGTLGLGRQLYVLCLQGNTDAYLGKSAQGRYIYKIGLSVSPDLRRQAFQKSMPHGAFEWQIYRTTKMTSDTSSLHFDSAVVGENAMKKYLAGCAEWLGGEFYLASQIQIDEAWELGVNAAQAVEGFDKE